MNILHYLNVIIGFSFVMLLLSIVTSFIVQAWLIVLRTKSKAIGHGLINILMNVGMTEAVAKSNIIKITDNNSTIFEKNYKGFLGKFSSHLNPLTGTQRNIAREEFLLLLMQTACQDKDLANQLGFNDENDTAHKLAELEKEILTEEVQDPKLPTHLQRTKAMQKIVPELTSKIFVRFDEIMERANEYVSTYGKSISIIITPFILWIFFPIDSIDLLNRLNKDQLLSAQLANIASENLPVFLQAEECSEKKQNKILTIQSNNPENTQGDECKAFEKSSNDAQKTAIKIMNQSTLSGIFKKEPALNFGVVVTWILVSLGSAFWLGILNKLLGIRSELSKKLETQREFREGSQQ